MPSGPTATIGNVVSIRPFDQPSTPGEPERRPPELPGVEWVCVECPGCRGPWWHGVGDDLSAEQLPELLAFLGVCADCRDRAAGREPDPQPMLHVTGFARVPADDDLDADLRGIGMNRAERRAASRARPRRRPW